MQLKSCIEKSTESLFDFWLSIIMFSFSLRKYPTPPLLENFKGGGVAKANILKEKYEAKFKFPEGGGWGSTTKS